MAAALLAFSADEANEPVSRFWPTNEVPGSLAGEEVLAELHYLPVLRRAHSNSWEVTASPRSSLCLRLTPTQLMNHPLRGEADEEAWRRSLCIALTRTCKPEGAPARLVAPIFDCANHVIEGEAELLWAWSNDALEVTTARDVEETAEIRISYGDHTAEDQFLQYGFVGDACAEERVVFFSGLYHFETYLNQLAYAEPDRDWVTHGAGEAETALLTGTYDCDDDFAWLCAYAGGKRFSEQLLDALYDAIVSRGSGKVLRYRARELLRGFGTTAEEDEELLRALTAAEDGLKAAAVQLRLAKKRVLLDVVARMDEEESSCST